MKKNILICVITSLLVSITVFVVGNFFMGNFENKKIADISLNGELSLVAGVIRNSGDGWSLIQDNDHETIGIKEVSQDNEKIIVKYDEQTKVNATTVTVDETMASEGYTVGASVGKSETWILIFDKEGKRINPSDYNNDIGNIWIQGVFKK